MLVWPAGAEAQSPSRRQQVGWLSAASMSALSAGPAAFRDALREQGWDEGRNLAIVSRYADGRLERLPALAAELVGLKVDVIVATAPPAVMAARQATLTVPIVMVYGPDPVASGLVASLSRPGGNVTGLTSLSADLARKQLELLTEMLPGLSRVAILSNPTNPWHTSSHRELEAIAHGLHVRLQFVLIDKAQDLDAAFATIVREHAEAVLALADPVTISSRDRLANLALKRRLPLMGSLSAYTEAGGLASYWPSSAEMFRRAAGYVHKILGGRRPAELPIEQPTTLELVINLKTARALGVAIPPAVLLRADRVVE